MLFALLAAVLGVVQPWDEVLARAERERKPIVVFYRTADCTRCDDFERRVLPHPGVQRRIAAVVFATLPAPAGETPHVALFDRSGVRRARWRFVPGTTNFAILLDNVAAVAPQLERAASGDAGAIALLEPPFRGSEPVRRERIVQPGETFWLRLLSPREGAVESSVRVTMSVRVPAARRVQRVVVSWNGADRTVLTDAPWETTIEIPAGQTGVLRAVAELDDGRTSEDAVLLNAPGVVEHASAHLVELPITVLGANDVTAERIRVREGDRARDVVSVATAAETPLTVGLLFDVSGSMHAPLLDAQEAAIRFLERILGERDRAFLVTFDTRARLVQPATPNLDLLRRGILSTRPQGSTALHDALVLGLLQFEGIKGRRAMVVLTDGLDITSRSSIADVRELARRVNVPIHVITLPLTQGKVDTRNAVPSIAPSTGGSAHALQNLAEIDAIYARIEAALRAQILAFIRTEPATRENEWRSVSIAIEGDGIEVYAPEGYYAAW